MILNLPKWNIQEITGYEPKTTFWQDFSIADAFGPDAVQDTYNRAFDGWKNNVVYIAELILVLNHKIWFWHEKNDKLAELYNKLWMELDSYAWDHFKGEDADYLFDVTD